MIFPHSDNAACMLNSYCLMHLRIRNSKSVCRNEGYFKFLPLTTLKIPVRMTFLHTTRIFIEQTWALCSKGDNMLHVSTNWFCLFLQTAYSLYKTKVKYIFGTLRPDLKMTFQISSIVFIYILSVIIN